MMKEVGSYRILSERQMHQYTSTVDQAHLNKPAGFKNGGRAFKGLVCLMDADPDKVYGQNVKEFEVLS